MSVRVAVLARDGRGGGEVIPEGMDKFACRGAEPGMAEGEAANGSCSTRVDGGVDGRECLRARGGGFWSELRTRGGVPLEGDLRAVGGGGAALVGTTSLAARAAWLSRSLYSWMDSLEGRWYSTVILDWRLDEEGAGWCRPL